MPGTKQVAAADRLTRGFCARSQSQQGGLPGNAGAPGDAEAAAEYAAKVATSLSHAREWRQRMDDVRNRRSAQSIVLQPKTFVFA
jgi:hypothetical protein